MGVKVPGRLNSRDAPTASPMAKPRRHPWIRLDWLHKTDFLILIGKFVKKSPYIKPILDQALIPAGSRSDRFSNLCL